MRRLITSFLLILHGSLTLAQIQDDNSKTKRSFTLNPWDNVNGIRLAAGYYNNLETEVSFIMSSYPKKDPGLAGLAMRIQYIGLGLEYLRVGQQNIIGTKVSYENTISILAVQIGADFLASDKDIQYRLLPKVGLTLFGTWTLYYGFNFDLKNQSDIKTTPHIISLQCNIESVRTVAIWR
jgi:hypothetical protein